MPEGTGVSVGPWRRHERRVAYENAWVTVYHDAVTRPDGQAGIYGVVHFANLAVGVVAIDETDRVALVGQHRYTLDTVSWEIPEGGSPHAEDSLDGARRELREETGVEARTWRRIGRYHLSNSVSDEEAVLYLATDLVHGEASLDGSEADLALRWVPFDEALAMIGRGEITDAMSVLGLQAVALERGRPLMGSPSSEAASWARFAAEAPELAAAIGARFAAHKHHIIGTIRADGRPRLSGTEVDLTDERELGLGMMPDSQKLRDVRRDPRVEIHSAPLELDLAQGDAKVTGRLEESGPVQGGGTMFVLRLERASLVRVDGDELELRVWRPGGGVRMIRRR